jgi:hypothetical protein
MSTLPAPQLLAKADAAMAKLHEAIHEMAAVRADGTALLMSGQALSEADAAALSETHVRISNFIYQAEHAALLGQP